jgi:hypothetical protein
MLRTVHLAAVLLLCCVAARGLAQTEWAIFPSEDGEFEGLFPETPGSYVDQRARNGVIATSRVLAAGSPAFYCMAGYTEYSASIARTGGSELAAARDDFINSWYATLLENDNVSLPRPPDGMLQAVRFVAIADTRRYTAIMAVDGTRFYHVIASSQRFGFSAGDVARCISGFKLRPNS